MFEYLLLLVTLFRAVVRDRNDLLAENLLLHQQLAMLTRPTEKRSWLRTRDKRRAAEAQHRGEQAP